MRTFVAVLLAASASSAFTSFRSHPRPSVRLRVVLEKEAAPAFSASVPPASLRRDRYIATNNFTVRNGAEAKFEKRWATRKSRLAELEGFKYFHLMRRVTLGVDGRAGDYDPGTKSDRTAAGNYVSFTIWDKKRHFTKWRTGEAFKEAHGGTSIGAFLSTMMSSLRVLRGAPAPQFYDGLLLQSCAPTELPEIVDGWRTGVEADGKTVLPAECFVACHQFFVPEQDGAAFEARWAGRESTLMECNGFVAFSLLRRDNQQSGHGVKPMREGEPTYVGTTIWRDREAFEEWRNGKSFGETQGLQAGGTNKGNDEKMEAPPKALWTSPPVPVFYEGVLVITDTEGA